MNGIFFCYFNQKIALGYLKKMTNYINLMLNISIKNQVIEIILFSSENYDLLSLNVSEHVNVHLDYLIALQIRQIIL